MGSGINGIGLSRIGMSGIGLSGIGMSGIGMSGISEHKHASARKHAHARRRTGDVIEYFGSKLGRTDARRRRFGRRQWLARRGPLLEATMQQCNNATHEYNTVMRLHASNRNCASGVAVLTVRRSISASLLGRCGSKRSGAALLHEPPMRAGMSSAACLAAHC